MMMMMMMMSHIISDVIDTSFQMGIHQQKWWLFSMTRIGRSLEWDLMKVNHSLCSTPHLGYEGQITRRNETCCKCCSNTAMKNAVWISKGFEYGQWMKRNWPTYNTPRRRLSHDISSFFFSARDGPKSHCLAWEWTSNDKHWGGMMN